MPLLVRLGSFLRNLFASHDQDAELDREVRSHLELLTRENIHSGMAPDEAQRVARIELGGVEQVKEQVREQRVGNWAQSVLADCRFAVRQLRKSPAFTLIAVLTLALGIGVATAIFSVIYGVLIRPLAVPEAQQVTQLVLKYHQQVSQDAFTYQEFRFLQSHSPWARAVAAFTHVGFNMSTGEAAERVSALHVSSDYFRVLAATPPLGREFTAQEDHDPGARVVILGYSLWQRRFSGDRSVLGATVHLNGAPYVVVGVMPPSLDEVQLDFVPPAFGDLQRVDLWTTLAPVADSVGSGENLAVVARLEPPSNFAQASSQLETLSASFSDRYLEGEGKAQSVGLSSVQKIMAGNVDTYLWILVAAVAFLLLVACSNVSNLVLAQGTARSKEVAIRAAMGASRGRLIRQFLSESLILSSLGCVCGFMVARFTLFWLLRSAPVQLPRVGEIHVDVWAFLFSLGATIFAGAFSAIIPSLHSAKLDVHPILKDSAAQSSASRRSGVFRGVLVVAEIALSIILLIGAALLAQTFVNLLRVNPGFDPSGLVSAEIWLTGSRHHSTAELNAFYDNLVERLKRIRGLQQTTVVSGGQPLERGGNIGLMVNGVHKGSMDVRVVTPDYFQTLRVPLKQGREFSRGDSANAELVVIVNDAFVRRFLNGVEPLGSSVRSEGEKDLPRRIVGVAADVKSYVDLPEGPTVFFPAAQADFGVISLFDVWFPTHILVRTSGDPRLFANAVRTAIRETDATIPIGRTLTMNQVLARSLAIQRFMMVVIAVFAALTLALAAIGIYGVISFSVSKRTQEFGIRMALGADALSVLGLVLREAAWLALLGLVIGIIGAATLYQTISSVLFGVRPTDPATIAFCALGLLLAIVLACCVPARRALRVDPMVALRYE